MVEQDLHADGDEDEAADDLHPPAEDGAEALAEVEPRGGEGARDETDHDARVDDPPVAKHAEADPHRQRVDAGRQRQDDEGDSPRGVLPAVPFLPSSPTPLLPHLSPAIAAQGEGEPVIVTL